MRSRRIVRADLDLPRSVSLILAMVIVAVPLRGAHSQTRNDHLIVPWVRIGPMTLGMTAAELVQIRGQPFNKRPGEVEVYNWHDLTATVTKDGLWTTEICTFSPTDITAEGVHVGSTDLSVTTLLGPPRYSRVFTAWWGPSYANLYWPGLMISAHLKGYEVNHSVWKICVNHFAAIAE